MAKPEGKYIGLAKLGPKSQVVIPKEVREIFGIGPGDQMLILADKERGIALVDPKEYAELIDKLLPPKGEPNASAN
ncbi:AbrB/MazE/SpoVT family DNA-binding domain-containing protein [Corynebacterium freiburgense]|uniref:AbrB/MazE/SpoVT family DNA-binding domain-containing protein n=1 Tax=Corynebacterium freiburgense TaxID=556548 RepID=UPI000404B321|nr:AbrB/MazE/SpoVT family DNA-binding domain-containing protein [Corynebacterium freiburgense]WJZ01593.1 SpoVT / AbrB like domain protein [Corynebacterium freiburgense]